ncbi:MAG: HAD hydrolase family protein [Armatimonadetes bacterium]|nr:HAD hydrolase family protein [Armatimonadota bacterium]
MVEERLLRIKLLAMDVDGVLTKGDVIYEDDGAEYKVFNIMDGLGITVAGHAGLLTAFVTGRKSGAVARRAKELKVTALCDGCQDKGTAIRNLRSKFNLSADEIAFVGDDINDIPAFRESGLRIAVSNASDDLKAHADIITNCSGGNGAIREVIEMILKAQGKWSSAVECYLRELESAGKA